MDEERKRLLCEFQKRAGIFIEDKELLNQALTHSSYSKRGSGKLEFLGDAVLGLIVAEYLYSMYPDLTEGELTKAKSVFVNRRFLALWGKRLNIGRYLLLSKGEDETGGRRKISIVAEAVEALIGAIFLDRGMDAARTFVKRWIADKEIEEFDHKSTLQEIAQREFGTVPQYKVCMKEGPDHMPRFKIEVKVGDIIALGEGGSKKEAEQNAASSALSKIKGEKDAKAENA
jgi:ribonuclease-3